MPRSRRSAANETVHLELDITVADLARQVAAAMSRDDALLFVKAIDLEFGDWDFTLALCQHFEGLKKDWEREESEDTKPARSPSGHAKAVLCEHANEVPMACPCPADCYCKTHTCKGRGEPEPWRHDR